MDISSKQVKIAGFGIACMDYIALAPETDSAGYTEIASYSVSGGGITGTSCAAASRLGAQVSYIGRLGDDDIGDQIEASLLAEGVDTSHIIRVPGGKSLFSWIRVDPDTAERFIYSRRDRDMDSSIELIDADTIREADVLLLDDHWPEGARFAAKTAKDAGIPVICDVRLRPQNYDLMPLVDYAVISVGYAIHLTEDNLPLSAPEGIVRLGAANAVVTCGEEGAWFLGDGKRGHVPAFAVDAVDTTGAGDVFHGAFAFALAKGLGIRHCTVFASAVAALKCTGIGGRAAIPTLEQTLQFLKERNVSI